MVNSYSYCATPPPGSISGHVASLPNAPKSDKGEAVVAAGGEKTKSKPSAPCPTRNKRGETSWRK
jgi:hypothetical protein